MLQYTLFDYEVTKIKKDEELSEQNLVESFLSAKRIEGCSEKTLKYYNATIQSMLDGIGNLHNYNPYRDSDIPVFREEKANWF